MSDCSNRNCPCHTLRLLRFPPRTLHRLRALHCSLFTLEGESWECQHHAPRGTHRKRVGNQFAHILHQAACADSETHLFGSLSLSHTPDTAFLHPAVPLPAPWPRPAELSPGPASGRIPGLPLAASAATCFLLSSTKSAHAPPTLIPTALSGRRPSLVQTTAPVS